MAKINIVVRDEYQPTLKFKETIEVGAHKDNVYIIDTFKDEDDEERTSVSIKHSDLDGVIEALKLVQTWQKKNIKKV